MTQLVITQADREAAADFGRRAGRLSHRDMENMIDGKWDETADVVAFAAHRQASTDYLVEALEEVVRKFDSAPDYVKGVPLGIMKCRAAIAKARSHE